MQDLQGLLSEYLPILIFIAIAAGLSIAMILGSMIVARQNPDSEKLSAYECGFEAFDDARQRFDVRFYLVTLLFIIFDLGWPSCSHGRSRWAISGCSASGRW